MSANRKVSLREIPRRALFIFVGGIITGSIGIMGIPLMFVLSGSSSNLAGFLGLALSAIGLCAVLTVMRWFPGAFVRKQPPPD
jgi:uncharacterized membrane protein YuzA (DUF378 family)